VGVIARDADDIAVMYAGRIVEYGPAPRVLDAPRHPYTRGLLAAMPRLSGTGDGSLVPIAGQPPDLSRLPVGCPFAERCPSRQDGCSEVTMLLDRPAADHASACPFVGADA
jgi:oligopeptide/dipeptide ABC transporter ATP-binding protein